MTANAFTRQSFAGLPAGSGSALPALTLVGLFFIVPVVALLLRSVTDPEPGLQNYAALFGSGTYVRVFLNTFLSNPGNIVIGNQTYAIPRGQNGTALTANELTPGTLNRSDLYTDADLLPSQRRLSLYGSGKQSLTDSLTLFGNAMVSQRDARQLSPELLVEQGWVPERDRPLRPRGRVVADEGRRCAEQRLRELAGIGDRRGGEQELRFGAVHAGQPAQPPQDVRDV